MKHILLILWIWASMVLWLNLYSPRNFLFSIKYVAKIPKEHLKDVSVGRTRLGVYLFDSSTIYILNSEAHKQVKASVNRTVCHEIAHWVSHKFLFAYKSKHWQHKFIDKYFLL